MRRKESIRVSQPDDGLVHVYLKGEYPDIGRVDDYAWFSVDNLSWVIERLREFLTTRREKIFKEKRGNDVITMDERGFEYDPNYLFQNRRENGPRTGLYSILMHESTAKHLLAQLEALQAELDGKP